MLQAMLAEMLTKQVRHCPVDPFDSALQLIYLAVRPYLAHKAAPKELPIPRPRESDRHG